MDEPLVFIFVACAVYIWVIGAMYTIGRIAGKYRKPAKWYGWITLPILCAVAWPFVLGGL